MIIQSKKRKSVRGWRSDGRARGWGPKGGALQKVGMGRERLEGGDQGKEVGAVERWREQITISGSLIRAGRQSPQRGAGEESQGG